MKNSTQLTFNCEENKKSNTPHATSGVARPKNLEGTNISEKQYSVWDTACRSTNDKMLEIWEGPWSFWSPLATPMPHANQTYVPVLALVKIESLKLCLSKEAAWIHESRFRSLKDCSILIFTSDLQILSKEDILQWISRCSGRRLARQGRIPQCRCL